MKVCKLGLLVAMLLSGGMAIAQGTAYDFIVRHLMNGNPPKWEEIKK